MKKRFFLALLVSLTLSGITSVIFADTLEATSPCEEGSLCASADESDLPLSQTPAVNQFIKEMVERHHFDSEHLHHLFDEVKLHPSIIRAISAPKEAKPWHYYRNEFLTKQRIEKGAHFWKVHSRALARAEHEYGVPASIIVAILGVESFYGQQQGKYRTLDALSTLAFDYPPRAPFFRKELEEYLLLTRENHIPPLSVKGSYAGAIGQPQFMPSSYRHYAVNYTRTGNIDLRFKTADAIGSVGNYFNKNGWRRGQSLIVLPLKKAPTHPLPAEWAQKRVPPMVTFKELHYYGIDTPRHFSAYDKAMLFKLDVAKGPEYWLGLQNFYAITRYNVSVNYAMAVYELSREIEKLHRANPVVR